MSMTFSLLEIRKQMQANLKDKFPHFSNLLAVPTVKKIVINTCCGRFMSDSKRMDQIQEQLMKITGQMPVETKAKKSVASFKLREGMHVGYRVTLRGKMASEFLFRLIYLNLPRIQDFAGFSAKALDDKGNYTLGIKDVTAFMEVDHDKETKFGIGITMVTNTRDKAEGLELLRAMRFPLKEFAKK